MARLPRLNLAGVPQHVVQRGNNKQACFFTEKDYAVYSSKLKEYGEKYGVSIHSYVLMTNHVHLLLTPETNGNGVSQLMQSLGRAFVRYINETQDRTGTLWQGRFKSALIDSESYFLAVSRYIELNPVRARMVAHPADYPWSSYQKNVIGKPVSMITPHYCYQSLGKTDRERQSSYQVLFNEVIPERTLTEIRDALNKSWVLGDDKFIRQIEQKTGRRISVLKHGGDRKSAVYLDTVVDQQL